MNACLRKRAAILVVENDPDLRRILALRLGAAGHHCVEAGSGADALAEWQRREFDLVVSDINMPGGDGLELADALQRSEAVPIVFVTGFRDDYKRRLRRVRDVVVLEKPFDPMALLEIVEALLLARGDGGPAQGRPPEAS